MGGGGIEERARYSTRGEEVVAVVVVEVEGGGVGDRGGGS